MVAYLDQLTFCALLLKGEEKKQETHQIELKMRESWWDCCLDQECYSIQSFNLKHFLNFAQEIRCFHDLTMLPLEGDKFFML